MQKMLAGDVGSFHGSGRYPGGGNGNPLKYSSLENPIDKGAWQAIVHEVLRSQTQLSTVISLSTRKSSQLQP